MDLKIQLAIAVLHLIDRIFGTRAAQGVREVLRIEFTPEQNAILERDYETLQGISARARERAAGGDPGPPPAGPPPDAPS